MNNHKADEEKEEQEEESNEPQAKRKKTEDPNSVSWKNASFWNVMRLFAEGGAEVFLLVSYLIYILHFFAVR